MKTEKNSEERHLLEGTDAIACAATSQHALPHQHRHLKQQLEQHHHQQPSVMITEALVVTWVAMCAVMVRTSTHSVAARIPSSPHSLMRFLVALAQLYNDPRLWVVLASSVVRVHALVSFPAIHRTSCSIRDAGCSGVHTHARGGGTARRTPRQGVRHLLAGQPAALEQHRGVHAALGAVVAAGALRARVRQLAGRGLREPGVARRVHHHRCLHR